MRLVLALALAVVVALRYAEPILDGDLFFHLAYAGQMLERGTLVPDHALYSWTPASNESIYCAWASELALAGLWNLFGLPALFVLRYAVVGGTLLLLWLHARRLGLFDAGALNTAFTYLVLTVVAVGERAGTLIKPELFSLLFLHLVLYVYFRTKWKASESAGATSSRASLAWWWVPAIVLVWANSHGGFILAAPFLALAAVGELLNRRLSPACALAGPALRRLLGAWSLCALAVVATPYGLRYPLQLIDEYLLGLGRAPRADTVWNNAYQAVLAWPSLTAEYMPILMLVGVALAGLLAVQAGLGRPGARVDWAIVLVNAVYVPLYLLHVRSTQWAPVVFGWSAVHLLGRIRADGLASRLPARFATRAGALVAGLAVAAMIAIGARNVRGALIAPWTGSWLGFGVGYVNPVAEAEYLATLDLPAGTRLYDIFDSGSYLLWRLYPRYRVMTDSRSFPYLAWFEDQYRFTMGETFDEFLERYPADVAVIDHLKDRCQRNFLQSPAWRMVFYGPTAAVFVRRDAPAALSAASIEVPAHGGLDRLRNAGTALVVFELAVAADDYDQAWAVLAQMEDRKLKRQLDAFRLDSRRLYRDAYCALGRSDFAGAEALLRRALAARQPSDRDRRVLALLEGRNAALAAGRLVDAHDADAALARSGITPATGP